MFFVAASRRKLAKAETSASRTNKKRGVPKNAARDVSKISPRQSA